MRGLSHLSRLIVCAVVLLLCAGRAKAAPITAYMTAQNADFGSLNLTTGVFTLLGNSGTQLCGLGALTASPNVLYGMSCGANAGLYTVNPANGSLSLIGNSGITADDFGSTTTGLFLVDASSNLYSVNPGTGAATLKGSTGLSLSGFRTLSTNSSALFFSTFNAGAENLYVLSTTTGAASIVGPTGGDQMGGMVLVSATLYGGKDAPGCCNVDTLSTLFGTATTGPAISGETSPVSGLAPFFAAAAVPEPGTLTLLGFGIGILALLRRR